MFGSIDRKALKYTLFWALGVFILGVLYYVFIRLTGLSFPCMIKQLSGLDCPTCGITRMFMHMAIFDFKSAMADNVLLFFIWPYGFLEPLYILYLYYAKKEVSKLNYIVLSVVLFFMISYGIIRNI